MLPERIKKRIIAASGAAIVVVALAVSGVFGVYDAEPSAGKEVPRVAVSDAGPNLPEFDKYGMPVGRYQISDGIVRRNKTFSDLLAPFDISYANVVSLAASTKETFDVRRIRAGRPYRVYLDHMSNVPEYFVYDQDQTSYVVFRLLGTPSAEVVERPSSLRRRTISGVINSSLYETLQELDVNPFLAIRMSEVFAWQIDFYRILKGDSFQIVYDEIWVGDHQIDIGEVHAARFTHFGEDYFAFHYADDTVDDFYDAAGQSVRKAFLIAPVAYSRISSGYSGRRYHPVLKRYRSHLGTDYVADYGTPIHATGDGVVEVAGFTSANGNWVKIRHNGTYTTGYLHMSRIAKGIRPGVHVDQGRVIGYVGSTGLATGNHVCYRFWKDRVQVDHRRQKLPSVGPIPPEHRSAFEDLKNRYMVELGTFSDLPYGPAYAMLLKEPLPTVTGLD